MSVERGVGGAQPGAPPAYVAACFFSFDSAESFMTAFMPHAAELQGDLPNDTDIAPQIQINEVPIASPAAP